MAKRRAN